MCSPRSINNRAILQDLKGQWDTVSPVYIWSVGYNLQSCSPENKQHSSYGKKPFLQNGSLGVYDLGERQVGIKRGESEAGVIL